MMRASDHNGEDPLTYLPRKPVQEFVKGRTIYDPEQPSDRIYVVILGRVKIVTTVEDGCQLVSRIVSSEGLFGESCLINARPLSESAVVLENVSLMAWTRAEVEQQIEREPRLGIALSQRLIRHCIGLQDRIESMAVYKTPERVMLALIQLAGELGSRNGNGATRVPALAHHTIAEYVGTSREIVTFQMNRLRRLGLIQYSRRFIDVHTEALAETLHERGIAPPRSMEQLVRVAG